MNKQNNDTQPEPKADHQETCNLCGRAFAIKELSWESKGLLCRDCKLEEKSCGCSD